MTRARTTPRCFPTAYQLLIPVSSCCGPTVELISAKPYEPQLHSYDPEAIKTYIYPTNHPIRRYQYEIVRNCFTDNTLVAIPTGLGKTFVAGVVMLNCELQ